jgi:hypothetical protein
MQQFLAFLGGCILGGLLSAAAGVRIFEFGATDRHALAEREEVASALRDELESVKIDRDAFIERLRRAERSAAGSRQESARSAREADALRLRRASLDEELLGARSELARTRDDLTRLRVRLTESHDEGARALAAAEILAAERDRLILELFSRPLGSADRELVRELLKGDGTLGEKFRAVVALRRYSPELLLALGDPEPHSDRTLRRIAALRGGLAAGVAPSSARQGPLVRGGSSPGAASPISGD